MKASKNHTLAVNGEKLKLLGQITFKTSFDIEGKYQVEVTAWVSAKDGCKPNLLGMDFLESTVKSIDLTTPKIDLKTYPEVAVTLSRYQTKSYPYISFYKIVTLDQQLPLAPKSTRVISIRPPNEFFRKGTSFVIGSELQAQGIYTYNVQCFRKEKELPIMLNNPQNNKVVIQKGPIGHTLEDIEIRQDPKFSVVDNVAFINHLMNSDTNWDQIFHVSEKQGPKISKIQNFFASKTPEKQKKTEKRKRQQDFTNNYELETDFSDDLKDLKPQLETTDENIRPVELPKEKLNRFDKTDQAFLKKFDFSQADINDENLDKLLRTLTKNKDVYSQHKYDVGKIKQKFHVKLLPNSTLTKQRPSKVPLHYQEKLENLLEQLCKTGIIREMGNDKEMGSEFINPIIILRKGNTVKLVIDARYLNSITDLSRYSWPLEPIGSLLTRLKGNFFTTSDLCSAYNQVPLTEETKQLVSFVIGPKQYTFERGFYGLCGLPNFFSRIMTIHFAPLIRKKQAITYIDDTIMQAQDETEMFEIIDKYHELLRKSGLKAQPEKTKFFLRKVQFLGHVVGKDGIQPVKKRVADLKALKSPENKRDVMKVLGCLGFYSMYIKNLHVDCKPFYDLTRTETKFAWTAEHEKLFNDIKNRISEDTILAIPDTKYPFHVHVDASSIGVGSILVQEFPEGKRIVSFNSRIYTKEEQKMSTTARELCGVISALQTYEHYLIGSPHPVYVYTDHKPLMYLWGRRGKLSHRFFRYQLVISQFQNLKIIWTEGKKLAFPDILSRNVKIKDLDKYQLKHKKIPKDISFYDEHGNEEKYFILRDNEKGPADDFFPILKQSITGIDKFIFKNDKMVKQKYDNNQNRLCSINNISEDFSYGSSINHYRRQRGHEITPVSEQEEDEKSDHYTEIDSCPDEGITEQNFDPISEFELFNENQSPELDFDKLYIDQTNTTDSDYRFPLEYDKVFLVKNSTCIDKTELAKKLPENPKIKDARELIDKLTTFSKEVDLNTSVICQEQLKDPVIQQIRQLRTNNNKDEKKIEFRQSKAIMSYINNFEKLSFVGNILCIQQQTDEPDIEYLKICVPLSLFFKVFQLAHCELSGHVGLDKTLANVKRFFFGPECINGLKT